MTEPQYPVVKLAATLIIRNGDVLAVHNPEWKALTLPMTKLREEEHWEDAAARAAAECLGVTPSLDPEECWDIHLPQVSHRDGEFKHYHFHVFHLLLKEGQQLLNAGPAGHQWLTPQDVITETPRSTSPTAPALISYVEAISRGKGRLPPWER